MTFPHAAPAPRAAPTPAEARAVFAALPLDDIPAPAALPAGSLMPLTANPLFVGRDDDLRALAAAITQRGTVAIVAATGLGGIGKTQLATEFALRYGQFFLGGVFWLNFADPNGVPAEVARCGGTEGLNLPSFDARKLDEQVARICALWKSDLPRLLVFDNCEDEALLAHWRPPHGGCRVLVTSRRAQWDAGLGVVPHPLGLLPRAAGVALLQRLYARMTDAEADALAQELGDLPLALHLAGSFLARYGQAVPPAVYLTQLRATALLAHPSLQGRGSTRSPTGHALDVGRTFALSYDRLQPADPADALALALLARAACFAPNVPVPRDLLRATVTRGDADEDALLHEDARARLRDLGLLDAEADGALRLHRLLAAFVRATSADPAAQTAVEQAMLARANELNNAGFPAPLLALQSHLRHIADAALLRADPLAAYLGNAMGYHLNMIGDYAGARPYFEQSLAIREATLGASHPDTATSLNNLGYLLQAEGDYAGARPYFEQSLAIRESALGASHPTTATSLNNLGELLRAQGDYAGARPYYERALTINEAALGASHSDTATSLGNLGALLLAQGNYAGARPYFERALAINEAALGASHPTTATSLNNLGEILRTQGDYAGARPYYERALTIYKAAFSASHPTTATSLNNLGLLLQAEGDYVGARPYFEQSLAIREAVLGASHPTTATSLNNLGALLLAQGDYAGSRSYYERACAIREAALGASHPDTAQSFNNLGYLLNSQDDYAGARPYYERALAIYKAALGASHPTTALSLNNLALLCYDENNFAEAATLMRRALAIREATLGAQHPDTQSSRQSLSAIEQHLNADVPLTLGAQIAQISAEAASAVRAAIADARIDRAALAAQLAARAQWAEEGEAPGSPYLALAAHLRALAARLGA